MSSTIVTAGLTLLVGVCGGGDALEDIYFFKLGLRLEIKKELFHCWDRDHFRCNHFIIFSGKLKKFLV